MKTGLGSLRFALILLFFLSVSAFSQGLSGKLCVQTFNVYATAYAPQTQPRLQRLGQELLREPCEAVQLQELWRAEDFALFRQALQPGRQAVVRGDTFRADDGIIGLASAFSGSVLHAHSELFRVNNEKGLLDQVREWVGVRKGLTAFEVKLDQAPEILFLNLHTHPTSQSVRVAQIIQLIDYALFRAPRGPFLPLVLTGDLNASPESLELELLKNVLLLRDGFRDTHGDYGSSCTYCSRNIFSWSFSDQVFDYTLYRSSPDVDLEPIGSEINLQGDEHQGPLSDHYGVRSQLGWQVKMQDLLPEDDPEVQQRIDLAIQSLRQARLMLIQETSETMQAAADLSLALLQKLSQPLPSQVSRLFQMKARKSSSQTL